MECLADHNLLAELAICLLASLWGKKEGMWFLDSSVGSCQWDAMCGGIGKGSKAGLVACASSKLFNIE